MAGDLPRSNEFGMASFLPGTSSLVEQLDSEYSAGNVSVSDAYCAAERILVVLRDGRHLVGTLRCFDQLGNFVLEDTFERHVVDDKFGDIPLGLYIVRGDNVVLLGEIVSVLLPFPAITVAHKRCLLLAAAQDEERQANQTLLSEVTTQEILELEQAKAAEEGDESKPNLWDFDKV